MPINNAIKIFLLILFFLVFPVLLIFGEGKWENTDAVLKAEQFMQQACYQEAYDTLVAGPIPEQKKQYAEWLKALALSKLPDPDGALTVCLQVMNRNEENPWIYKIRFLAAEIYYQQKKFNEAEAIYETEAVRLLSKGRKEEIARLYMDFARVLAYKPKADELDKPAPDYDKAYNFYKEVLLLEISTALRQEVRFQMARMRELAGRYAQAISEYNLYLNEFDPDWFSNENVNAAKNGIDTTGLYRAEARYNLAECYIKRKELAEGRRVLVDLVSFLQNVEQNQAAGDDSGDVKTPQLRKKWQALARRRIPYTYGFPSPATDADLEAGLSATTEFLKLFPDDPIAVNASWQAISALNYRSRGEEAITAIDAFLKKEGFIVLTEETEEQRTRREAIGIQKNPQEQYDELQKSALFLLGNLYFYQKDYRKAIEVYTIYTVKFPNGADWTGAQRGILDSEYQIGVDYIKQKQYSQAQQVWEEFLLAHPLDNRSRKILFALGQMEYQQGLENKEENDLTQARSHFQLAINGFRRLVKKYPRTEESSLAQLRIGELYENELDDLTSALEAYRALTWGSYASEARLRVEQMVNKELVVKTERIYRTDEQAYISLQLRNIEKVTISVYKLDMAEYFHKFHTIRGVENLDLTLIEPDKTWEVPVDGYAKYLPIAQNVEIPMNGAAVYAVNVAEEDFEATTLLIRSDLDIIVKSGRNEVLVFVQNMRANQPEDGANVLITDGTKPIWEGKTNGQGVAHEKLEELKETDDLSVFVTKDGSISSNLLNLRGLGFDTGLAPRAYIYTDQPVYLPGQTVNIRGIVRNIKEGSYFPPAGESYTCAVADSQGRVLHEQKVVLSRFGTFEVRSDIGQGAVEGEYTVRLSQEKPKRVYSASFMVKEFSLAKVKLELSFDRNVYFRGETIKATFKASYYYGQPLVGRELRYTLPDNRELTALTDENGQVKVEFSTAPFRAGNYLHFSGRIIEQAVTVQNQVLLAAQGFSIDVGISRPVCLTGESLEINIKTIDMTGNPVSRELELKILRREIEEADPLLASIPWMTSQAASRWAEKEVQTLKLNTDEKGIARQTFIPREGGQYVYRVKGKDRLNNIITAQAYSFVSGDEDLVKVRLFSDKEHYRVGEQARVRIHCRLENTNLALVTHQGEGIIKYHILELKPGENPLNFTIEHAHFPNFSFEVALMSQNSLQMTALPFTVERELKIKIIKKQEEFLPGQQAEIEVEIKDHMGKAVETEISLAMVNEAIYAVYEDFAGEIVAFFNQGTIRITEMRTQTSCNFSYAPITVGVIRELKEEEERLKEEIMMEEKEIYMPEEEPELTAGVTEKDYYDMDETITTTTADEREKAKEDKVEAVVRRSMETGVKSYWQVTVITDKEGKGVFSVPLPESTSAYRITVKGCTTSTLVGQAVSTLTVSKPFFVELKYPEVLQENDEVRMIATVHNLSTYQGKGELVLNMDIDGKTTSFSRTLDIAARQNQEIIFDEFKIPAGNKISLSLDATAGSELKDGIEISLPIQPWGLEFSDRESGVAQAGQTVFLELPTDKEYENLKMDIAVGASVNQELVDLVTGQSKIGAGPAFEYSELLAYVSLISYLEQRDSFENDLNLARNRAKALVSQLTSTQRSDGGWSYGKGSSSIEITAGTHWALSLAGEVGLYVDPQVLKRSEEYLKNKYSSTEQDDYGRRAMILHALSRTGAADYTFVNRLYRERMSLSPAALAYTAICLFLLDHKDMGLDIISILTRQAVIKQDLNKKLQCWLGDNNIVWERSDIETTALILLAYELLKPDAEIIPEAIEYLMQAKGYYGFSPAKARGVIIAALTGYYGRVKQEAYDYELEISVNDKYLDTFKAEHGVGSFSTAVAGENISTGENKVAFTLKGRGEYVYKVLLSGFSRDIKTQATLDEPEVEEKKYIHENLTFNGRSIGQSTMEIKELEYGTLAQVQIEIHDYTYDRYLLIEETIPAGCTLLKDTIKGNYSFVYVQGTKLMFYFEPDEYISTLTYQLAGYVPGTYKMLPLVIKDMNKPGDMWVGDTHELVVLGPDKKSSEAYVMNKVELFNLGKAYYDANMNKEAIELLEKLHQQDIEYKQRDVAQMLLWLRTEEDFYEDRKVVEYFEILKENYPDLYIPFDKILIIGKAYRDIGEYERAYIVYRATVDVSFLKDAPAGGTLEQAGEVIGSIEFVKDLWQEYPDSSAVTGAYLALGQELYAKALQDEKILSRSLKDQKTEITEVSKEELMDRAEVMLWRFMSVYPRNPLADDAGFSFANLQLDRQYYSNAVSICSQYLEYMPDSEYASSFQYMQALAYFFMRKYNSAIISAQKVAEIDSEDKDLALYILGQIYHAQNKPAQAIEYYKEVSDKFPDAKKAAEYFELKEVAMDEVVEVLPGEQVEVNIKYRNISEAHIKVYKVDLMRLYLKEKNLSRIANINLSGIAPELETKVTLGSGKDYEHKEKGIPLDIKEEGAYLVVCRGDELFTSCLILITPFKIEIQEEAYAGTLRVNVIDQVNKRFAANVHVKVIGSENESFISGETDLRGVFIAENVQGVPTVIARDRENRYAFYRSQSWYEEAYTGYEGQTDIYTEEQTTDYRDNLRIEQQTINETNRSLLDELYEEERKGVQVQEAY